MTQKFNDYLEILSEVITTTTKEVNGKQVKAWEGEELDEIIAGQVIFLSLSQKTK